MTLSKYSLLAMAAAVGLSHGATNDEWAKQSIYQLITDRYARANGSDADCDLYKYCGGSWAGIVDKLDYIAGMGFTAVQISPIVENIPNNTIYGEAFHGYWSQNNYALNTNFGDASDLKNLSDELHKRDMYLLVDVVSNEMAASIGDANMTSSTDIDYSVFYPFDNAEYFHSYCSITDWSNETMYTSCWLGTEGVATPTLELTNSTVAGMQEKWIKELVSNYSIDGIRIDGAKQIETGFFQPFVSSAGVYAMGEVDDGDASFVCDYQNATAGLENYPLYYTIIRAFTAGEMSGLVGMIGDVRAACSKTQYLATFIENQDNERFASYTDDIELAKNAMAFTLTADGIPKIYYGSEQHLTGLDSPANRQPLWTSGYNTSSPLYVMISKINKLRNHAISVNSNYVSNTSTILYTDDSTYAARKGIEGVQIVSVLSNQGKDGKAYQLSVPGAGDEGLNLTEILGCTTVVAGKNGTITVDMEAGAPPKIFFPTFNLNGSGLCGTESSKTTNSSSSSTSSSGSSSSSSSSTSSSKSAASRILGLENNGLLTAGVLGVAALLFL